MINCQSSAFDFLDTIGDAILLYKAHKKLYDVKVTVELPEEAYDRFYSEFNKSCQSLKIEDFDHGMIRFSILKSN
jgi:hypothetical protein